MVRTKYRPVASQVVEVVHNNRHEQVDYLQPSEYFEHHYRHVDNRSFNHILANRHSQRFR